VQSGLQILFHKAYVRTELTILLTSNGIDAVWIQPFVYSNFVLCRLWQFYRC